MKSFSRLAGAVMSVSLSTVGYAQLPNPGAPGNLGANVETNVQGDASSDPSLQSGDANVSGNVDANVNGRDGVQASQSGAVNAGVNQAGVNGSGIDPIPYQQGMQPNGYHGGANGYGAHQGYYGGGGYSGMNQGYGGYQANYGGAGTGCCGSDVAVQGYSTGYASPTVIASGGCCEVVSACGGHGHRGKHRHGCHRGHRGFFGRYR